MSADDQQFVVEEFVKNKNYQGLKTFDCGDQVLNRYAKDNLKRDGNRDNKKIHVLLNPSKGEELVGFVSSHVHLLTKDDIPAENFPHALPKAVPVIKISMIAVSNEYQNKGWGSQLLLLALDHAHDVSQIANDIKGVSLDAKKDVVALYKRYRFSLLSDIPNEDGTYPMFLSITQLRSLYEKRKQAIAQEAAS